MHPSKKRQAIDPAGATRRDGMQFPVQSSARLCGGVPTIERTPGSGARTAFAALRTPYVRQRTERCRADVDACNLPQPTADARWKVSVAPQPSGGLRAWLTRGAAMKGFVQNHRDGVVHRARADAEADAEEFDGKTTGSRSGPFRSSPRDWLPGTESGSMWALESR